MPVVEVEEKQKGFKKPWVKAILGLVVLGALVGIGFGLWQWRKDTDTAEYNQAKLDDRSFRWAGTPEKAVAEWEKYRAGLPPRQYIYEADLFEGSLLEDMQRDDDALKIYHDAEAHRKDSGAMSIGEYQGIARIAERKADYQTAITYYTKIEALYVARNPKSPEAAWTKNHIAQLQAKEQSNAAK